MPEYGLGAGQGLVGDEAVFDRRGSKLRIAARLKAAWRSLRLRRPLMRNMA